MIVKRLLPLIAFAARAAADESGGACTDGDGGDGSCPAAAEATPRRPRRGGGIDDLPPEYRSQLEHIDEQLRDEREHEDPIITCRAYLEMDEGHGNFVDPVSITHTLHQEISWAESTEKPDKCLTLDDTLQICNSYRPHYHEYFVHFPAAFVPQMRRALFVGGGDSMLLHELLKYPDMELVVGLELDQAVVRESLKHFFTQPHFEMHPRVQWWFGDAAKSLRLLPREWYGTFDLVMVDLSETAMSMTVSEELDILKALALLLDPRHGIFVKNEKYEDEMSDIFDHVIQIYLPDTPLLCDQDWVLGSFGIDFLHPDFDRLLGQHKIPTHHYKPKEDTSQHYELIKDYSKNDIDVLSHCTKDGRYDDRNAHGNATNELGMFMAVEAENSVVVSHSKVPLEEILSYALANREGLRVVTSETLRVGVHQSVVIVLQEGYIVARTWPLLRYVAFDINFWSAFHLVEATREVLLRAVGADKSSSTYRIVVGGMHGTDRRREDYARVGPAKTNFAKCKEPLDAVKSESMGKEEVPLSNSQVALQESLALLASASDDEAVKVVFCGLQLDDKCESLSALRELDERVVAVWACPKDATSEGANFSDDAREITPCEKQIDHVLREITSKLGRMHLVVIDAAVPSVSVIDIANALIKVPPGPEESLVNDQSLVVLPSLHQIGAYFLEICRMNLVDSKVAVVSMDDDSSPTGAPHYLGYLTLGDPSFLAQLVGVMSNISDRTGSAVSLAKMKSSPAQTQPSYSPHHYTMFDYDEAPGMGQYSEQMPLGKQTLLQMNFHNTTMSEELLDLRMQDFLESMNVTESSRRSQKVGDGIVIYALFNDGHAIVVWNGRQSIDTNLFTHDETISHKDLFEEHFMKRINLTSTLTLWEEQPRGVGRVINFSKDLVAIPGCVDRYILCDKLFEHGECDAETEKEWMYKNCPLACDQCPDKGKD